MVTFIIIFTLEAMSNASRGATVLSSTPRCAHLLHISREEDTPCLVTRRRFGRGTVGRLSTSGGACLGIPLCLSSTLGNAPKPDIEEIVGSKLSVRLGGGTATVCSTHLITSLKDR